jgi:hypothetical protein
MLTDQLRWLVLDLFAQAAEGLRVTPPYHRRERERRRLLHQRGAGFREGAAFPFCQADVGCDRLTFQAVPSVDQAV